MQTPSRMCLLHSVAFSHEQILAHPFISPSSSLLRYDLFVYYFFIPLNSMRYKHFAIYNINIISVTCLFGLLLNTYYSMKKFYFLVDDTFFLIQVVVDSAFRLSAHPRNIIINYKKFEKKNIKALEFFKSFPTNQKFSRTPSTICRVAGD